MVKMKNVQMYKFDEIPEHILEEMKDLAQELLYAWKEISTGKHSNIANGAWNFAHAAQIVQAFKDEFIHEAARGQALALIKNVELLLHQKGIPYIPFGQE